MYPIGNVCLLVRKVQEMVLKMTSKKTKELQKELHELAKEKNYSLAELEKLGLIKKNVHLDND